MAADRPGRKLWSDIAPVGGRADLESSPADKSPLSWHGDFSLGGRGPKPNQAQEVELIGKVIPRSNRDKAVWAELETSPTGSPLVNELFLVGSRPLPRPDITCMCRHPRQPEFLLAATDDAQLLWLEADLQANLRIVNTAELPAPVVSMVCSGPRIAALAHHPHQSLVVIDLDGPGIVHFHSIQLDTPLNALAENDGNSVWGLNGTGTIYMIQFEEEDIAQPGLPPFPGVKLHRYAHLGKKPFGKVSLKSLAVSIYRAIKSENYSIWKLCSGHGAYQGLAFDGRYFWAFRSYNQDRFSTMLFMYNQAGQLLRGFTTWPEAAVASLNFAHNLLLVTDREKNLYHQYYLADSMQPVDGGPLAGNNHPGYLAAGDPRAGGIHDLCLLYVGGQGKAGIHRYDIDGLKPLVAYISDEGVIQDQFMDGFLMLAQYSPLLNGRAFAADLKGPPSRQEDWTALFDEYFRPDCNLQALEECAETINRQPVFASTGSILKIVLAIPAPDRRCLDWDGNGRSLVSSQQRINAIDWAMQDLIRRWSQAKYKNLQLVGFYYINEQGAWNDPVLQAFPVLCRKYEVESFAIPGVSSTWLTEFKRAGFGGVALQSSHAFQTAANYPPKYLLKCAAGIAREFGMGMEVELPYDVMEPAGQAKLRDYLEMAAIQGWGGAFKAYFQSYDLIHDLAVSSDAECRRLYDDLYRLSRSSYHQSLSPLISFQGSIPVKWQGKWENDDEFFKVNIEGHLESFEMTGITVK